MATKHIHIHVGSNSKVRDAKFQKYKGYRIYSEGRGGLSSVYTDNPDHIRVLFMKDYQACVNWINSHPIEKNTIKRDVGMLD